MMTNQHRSVDSLWYDDDVGVYRFEYDAGDDLLVELVLALADVLDEDPTDLDPIAPYVDPDRLDACVASLNGDRPNVDGKVTFSTPDCDVTVLPGQVVLSVHRRNADGRGGVERRAE